MKQFIQRIISRLDIIGTYRARRNLSNAEKAFQKDPTKAYRFYL